MNKKYKLYTTYLSNLKNLDTSDAIVAIVMRFPPFIPKEKSNMIHIPELSPTGELLLEYKENKDFDSFKDKLWEQWNSSEESTLRLKQIEYALDNSNDVYLVCCEKDYNECHRKILGEHFEFLGYEWEEV